ESTRQELTAGLLLGGRRLVFGRDAGDGVGNKRVAEFEAVARGLAILTGGEADLPERGVEQVAGIVAGERAARAIGPLEAGGEADDDERRGLVAPIGHRVVVPVGMKPLGFCAKSD